MSHPKYTVSSTPHIRSEDSVAEIMKDVLVALAPASLMGIYFFGLRALLIIALSVASCLAFEGLYQRLTGQRVTISDCSAAVTGLLLALNLPASSPFWMPIVGSFFAIVIVKQLFGGLGQNFMNPALAARAFLLISYPVSMTAWTTPVHNLFSIGVDAVSSATPLGILKEGGTQLPDLSQLILGNVAGCIGETCVIALVLGGVYLLIKKIISWRIPATYLGTVLVLGFLLGRDGLLTGNSLYELCAGGLMLGAFFMATDYSSSPVTPNGQLIMGVGCGVLTVLIRVYGGYPEGVSFAILIMNLFVPLIDRFTKPKVFGVRKAVK